MMALSILRLQPPFAKIVAGEVNFRGTNLLSLSEKEMRDYRGRDLSMVLQDPMTALNPVFTIGEQIEEGIRIHEDLSTATRRERVVDLLQLLNITNARQRIKSYPHEFSGGMRQRVVSAVALACAPEILIADEPTTALDATVQYHYLHLLKRVQRERSLAIIYITHDLDVVARMCDRVAVMYAGRIVETGPTANVLARPSHPYTRALLRSAPTANMSKSTKLNTIEGTPPSLFEVGLGCPFAPRCPDADNRCQQQYPAETAIDVGHLAACWRLGGL